MCLMFVSLLVVMMGALLLVVRDKLFQSQAYQNQTAALYLAELAVADAMYELGQDPGWTTGFTNKSISGVDGSYTVRFHTTGGVAPSTHSVNNFDGQSPDSHYGTATLKPGECSLVAEATVGRSTRVVEAVVDLGGGLLPVGGPLVVDGQILMEDRVTVDGIRSLREPAPIEANLHSNLSDAANNLIQIDDTNVAISGTVSIVSSETGSINLGSYTPGGGPPSFGAAAITFTPIDIAGTVSSKSSAASIPSPVAVDIGINPSSGDPSAAYLDVSVLTYDGGPEYYNGGDLFVGDLKLEGASLYVNGDLTVNGAITGSGSVWVNGNTSFRGSSDITTANPDKVALYSQGNVRLEGFNGGQLINQYRASGIYAPEIGIAWDRIQDGHNDMLTTSASLASVEDLGPGNGFDAGTADGRSLIGSGFGNSFSPTTAKGYAAALTYEDPGRDDGGYHLQTSPTGQRWLFARGASPDRDFLIRRFFELYKLNFGPADDGPDELFALSEARAGRLGYGAIDAINDQVWVEGLPLIDGYLQSFNLNHLGSSYFQGQIYTKGYFESLNDVTIIGSLVTQITPGARGVANLTDGVPDPGDVIMRNGSRLLYVEEFFQPRPALDADGNPGVRVLSWHTR